MAILFTTGTINQADAGSVGLAMVEKIRDDVVVHPAWDLVEEFTPASGLVRWYVFKCLAAQSGLPSDFYVIFGRTLGSGELRAFVCEGYNAATHVATFFSSIGGSASLTAYDASGRISGSTVTLGTAVLSTSNAVTNPRHLTWLPSGTSTKYWVIVSEDTVSIAFNGASNGFMHFGAYTWLGSLVNPMPLHQSGTTSSSGANSFTRNPAMANQASASYYGVFGESTAFGGTLAPLPLLGFVGRLDVNDKSLNDRRPVAECGLTLTNGSPGAVNDAASIGWVMGKAKRVRYGTNAPAGIAFGDAYAHNGTLWVPYLPTDGRIWDTGVAA